MRTACAYLTVFALITTALIYATTSRFSSISRETVVHALSSEKPPLSPSSQHSSRPQTGTEHAWAGSASDVGDWSWSYGKDVRNYGLNEEQCHVAFPDLYHEIDRAVAYRKRNKIQLDDVETGWRGDGIVRAMIYNNQLYIIENRGVWDANHRPRSIATLHSLHRAITAYQGILPNVEFTITDHDSAEIAKGHHTTWAYSRLPEQESLWLMPDFGLWGWPDVGVRSYAELQTMIEDTEVEFVDKKPRLVWRGNVNVGARDVRSALLRASEGHSWSDVRALDWSNSTNIAQNLLTMEDHCAYMFVAQTEGNTYSGRLKYLLNCQSVLISHKLKFVEHFHHLLRSSGPDQNYVQVKRDFADLGKTMAKYLKPKNMLDAERIAENARAVFRERYLTPAAVSCYWRQLIRGWSEVQGFETVFWTEVEIEKGGKKVLKRKPRGVPFESYVIMEAVDWTIPTKPRKICEYD